MPQNNEGISFRCFFCRLRDPFVAKAIFLQILLKGLAVRWLFFCEVSKLFAVKVDFFKWQNRYFITVLRTVNKALYLCVVAVR